MLKNTQPWSDSHIHNGGHTHGQAIGSWSLFVPAQLPESVRCKLKDPVPLGPWLSLCFYSGQAPSQKKTAKPEPADQNTLLLLSSQLKILKVMMLLNLRLSSSWVFA
ncbi:uncharacterized protein V6R79_020428 [Siganus canaliculatus]